MNQLSISTKLRVSYHKNSPMVISALQAAVSHMRVDLLNLLHSSNAHFRCLFQSYDGQGIGCIPDAGR